MLSKYQKQLDTVFRYHEKTKHNFAGFAHGPDFLDWANQPDPFRRYQGADIISLPLETGIESPAYDSIYFQDPARFKQAGHGENRLSARPFNNKTISCLFRQSLALSAWKQAGDTRWPLRVNPSSGNLHPTESYLLCGPTEGLTESPMVGHYGAGIHGLEKRAEIPLATWQALQQCFQQPLLLIGITSIHWREAWKYGERAYRYCHHDAGHAIAAISLASASLGWQCRLLDDLSENQLGILMGTGKHEKTGAGKPDHEHPDCLLAITANPVTGSFAKSLPNSFWDEFKALNWQGVPNNLSTQYVHWPIIEEVSAACEKPVTVFNQQVPVTSSGTPKYRPTPAAHPIFQQRRSAVDMDGQTSMSVTEFYGLLARVLPDQVDAPFNALAWTPRVHLLLFVHRVDGLNPGLYILLRNPALNNNNDNNENSLKALKNCFSSEFEWTKPDDCPAHMNLYRLVAGDARQASQQLSCSQAIAAEGCFSLGMLADFENTLRNVGPWLYPRLYWECGAIGQVLYLEAESIGLRATGIGCFFDDPVHQLAGIMDKQFQSLYHFTVGGPVDDPRLVTLPPYDTSPEQKKPIT